MEKRLIAAIVLSGLVIFAYPYLLKKIYPASAPQAQGVKPPEAQDGRTAQTAPAAATGQKERSTAEPSLQEELTIVETPLYKAAFSNIDGGVKKWELKNYRVTQAKDSPAVSLIGAAEKYSTFRTQIKINGTVEDVDMRPSGPSLSIGPAQSGELIYTGATRTGLRIEKRLTFSGSDYTVHTELKIQNTGAVPVSGTAETSMSSAMADSVGKDGARFHSGPVIKTKDKLLRQTEKEPALTGTNRLVWYGIESKYFLEAFIPRGTELSGWNSAMPDSTFAASPYRGSLAWQLNLAPGAAATFNYDAFMGPKEYDILIAHKNGLEEAIEFGWFAFMAKPLLVVLNFFDRYVRNYGIAIIFLTVIIKVIFYPLTKHSLTSMREMQKIQPQLVALKERFKNDKDKLNKEMMALYKRYKINPVSGCLPMVLQIPVFIALYEVLYVAIELRHAPLFLWITDLSAKDPYYVTPLIMGATMFLQQKMTPTSVDPAQAKVMLFMPVVFTFMFLSFPSGLVVYWLVNNVLSIAQQYYIQRPAKA